MNICLLFLLATFNFLSAASDSRRRTPPPPALEKHSLEQFLPGPSRSSSQLSLGYTSPDSAPRDAPQPFKPQLELQFDNKTSDEYPPNRVRDTDILLYKSPHADASNLPEKALNYSNFIRLNKPDDVENIEDLKPDHIKNFLMDLNILPKEDHPNIFYQIEKSKEKEGNYTSALFYVYACFVLKDDFSSEIPRRLVYIVKFDTNKTPHYAHVNLEGVKLHPTLRSQHLSFPYLPRLALTECTAKLEIEWRIAHFSVMHAAQGQTFKDIIAAYTNNPTPESKNYFLQTLQAIAFSTGAFHAYHAFLNPKLRQGLLCFSKSGNLSDIKGFETIIHGDLHPGNIMIDKMGRVIWIDLESMFVSAVLKGNNVNDTRQIMEKTHVLLKQNALLQEDSNYFMEIFEGSYKNGLRHMIEKLSHFPSFTLKKFRRD